MPILPEDTFCKFILALLKSAELISFSSSITVLFLAVTNE
jgi:hypothetical protein